MVEMGKFVHTQNGKHIMSFLLGFGLASLFRTICKDRMCLAFHAPPLEEIKGKIYKFGEKCYNYTPTPTKCDKSKKIVNFA
jgi:hypothetical protein